MKQNTSRTRRSTTKRRKPIKKSMGKSNPKGEDPKKKNDLSKTILGFFHVLHTKI
jgi:hypothetical protein